MSNTISIAVRALIKLISANHGGLIEWQDATFAQCLINRLEKKHNPLASFLEPPKQLSKSFKSFDGWELKAFAFLNASRQEMELSRRSHFPRRNLSTRLRSRSNNACNGSINRAIIQSISQSALGQGWSNCAIKVEPTLSSGRIRGCERNE